MQVHATHLTDAERVCRDLMDDGLLYADEFQKVIHRCPMFAALTEEQLAQIYGFCLSSMVVSGCITWLQALKATDDRPRVDTPHRAE